MRRVLTLALALLLCLAAATLLSGCSKDDVGEQLSWKANEDPGTYFARILPLGVPEEGPSAREKFTAAYRGYNMSAEGFDDNNLGDPTGETFEDRDATTNELIATYVINLDGAKAALDMVKPADDASIAKFDEYKNVLTAEQVVRIVQRMQETVVLETNNGPIDTLLVWIGTFLKWITNITGGYYVPALFIFALIVELLMLPFGIRQQFNFKKQAHVRPKEMAIRKKYAGRNDQVSMRKMQEEIQRLYQQEGVNPMGGCLPLLIQMPIVIALYNIVVDPVRYVFGKAAGLSTALSTFCTTSRAAGGLGQTLNNSRGTIEILSKSLDNTSLSNFAYFGNSADVANQVTDEMLKIKFNFLGMDTGLVPGFRAPWILLLIPVLTFVFYFASMKLNRKFSFQPAVTDQQVGCSNNVMDITMPLMSVYITFIVPAALGLYWMVKCVLGTLKQFILHKAIPIPPVTEEQIKEAERALKGKARSNPTSQMLPETGRPIRSLHYIDEDDEDMAPAPKAPAKKKTVTKGGAPLKTDRKDDEK